MYFVGGAPEKDFNTYCKPECRARMADGKLQCRCGETDGPIAWLWDTKGCNASTTVVSNDGRDVLFHPVFSTGTAVVRGSEMFEMNKHYYFEVKMLTRMYGTDIMIGVGTSKMNLSEWKSKYCSTLGTNEQSWGYSYRGTIQHDGLKRSYGDKFSMGSLIGVHVDMSRGTLEYYLNRLPLGVAFTGLKNRDLFPMISSTAAQSAVRLTCSAVFSDTLQFQCLRQITNDSDLLCQLRSIPGSSNLLPRNHFWLIPEIPTDEQQQPLDLEDEAVIPLETLIKGKSLRKNKKLNKWGRYVDADTEIAYKSLVEKLRRKLLKEKWACGMCKSGICVCESDEWMDVNEVEMDFYGDLPAPNEPRRCVECSFRLGDHDVCKKDVLCSICDIII